MTPLSAKEQLILAGILLAFVLGSLVLLWQEKHLDWKLEDIAPKPVEMVPAKSAARSPLASKKSDQISTQIVSLTHASAEELEQLPGIGPHLAQEVIAYRQANPIHRVEDLLSVPGIGPKRLEKIRSRVKVD